jgi:hypothetical protein
MVRVEFDHERGTFMLLRVGPPYFHLTMVIKATQRTGGDYIESLRFAPNNKDCVVDGAVRCEAVD